MADDLPPAGEDVMPDRGSAADGSAAGADGQPFAPGLVDQPKSGGLGGMIGALLRGLQPAVHRTRRTTSRVRRRTGTSGRGSATGGSRGTLLQLRYHVGSAGSG